MKTRITIVMSLGHTQWRQTRMRGLLIGALYLFGNRR
jgi:hypothetical protein